MSAKDQKSTNLYAAAMNGGVPALEPTSAGTATAASVTVKREPGMISVKSLLVGLGEIAADEVQVSEKVDRKTAKVEMMLAASREAAAKKAAADAKNVAGMRMAAAPGQPGYHAGAVSIIGSRRRMFHQVDADVLKAAGNPDPSVMHRIAGMAPKGDLAGVFSFGQHKAASVSPFVDFANRKFRVIGHVEVSHPQTKPALGQTGFTGDETAYANTVKAGTYSEELYLTNKTWTIPVMVPAGKSDSGLSASLGITFAFDESVCALLMPSPTDAKAVFANMVRIMKDKFAVGEIDVIGDDQKETKKMAAVSLVGMCELLTHYDVKSSFHFWYKAGTAVKAVRTAKDKPMFYDSENMVGGVFGQIYLFVQQIVLQYESGMAPAVIKPKNDGLKIQLDETHRAMMSLADENLKLKTENAALKAAAAAANNDQKLDQENKLLKEYVRKLAAAVANNDVVNRKVDAVLQNAEHKSATDVKTAIVLARTAKGTAPSNLSSLSNLPSLAKKPAVAAAAATAAAAAAAQDDESEDESAMADAVPKA